MDESKKMLEHERIRPDQMCARNRGLVWDPNYKY